MNPRDSALNKVYVNGIANPGRARISGAGIPYKWDVRQAYGRAGATVVGMGRDLSKFTLTIEMWEPAHFILWEFFKTQLEPPGPFALPFAVNMQSPILADLGISSVVVEERGQLELASNGIWSSTSKILEYRKPIPAILKPRGSVPAPDGSKLDAPTEADKALIDAQAAFATARAGG